MTLFGLGCTSYSPIWRFPSYSTSVRASIVSEEVLGAQLSLELLRMTAPYRYPIAIGSWNGVLAVGVTGKVEVGVANDMG